MRVFRSNYATMPILGGVDVADGGSGMGVVMLCTHCELSRAMMRHALTHPLATEEHSRRGFQRAIE